MKRKFFNFNQLCEKIPELKEFAGKTPNDTRTKKIYEILDLWADSQGLEFSHMVYCENGLYVFKKML